MSELGRRERKKAATRKAISDAATRLFMERGFDEVSVREVADHADVSPTTVFAHFPQKEALVFDEDDEQREQLIAAVRNRPAGTSISDALRDFYRTAFFEMDHDHDGSQRRQFFEFIDSTPALRDYAAGMWIRHESALADVITSEAGLDTSDESIRIYSRLALQVQVMASQSADPAATIEAGFRILNEGWNSVDPLRPRNS